MMMQIIALVASILCAGLALPSEAARSWKDRPALDGSVDHVNMTRMIGGDHVLRNELFSSINRRSLVSCAFLHPYVNITTNTTGPLANVQVVTVTVSGIEDPAANHFIAVMSPSNASTDYCPHTATFYAVQTGDKGLNPLTCHYPVKYKYLNESDPGYLSCSKPTCQQMVGGVCLIRTCSASVSFRLINIRTDLIFVFFTGGMAFPCMVAATAPLEFAYPKSPLSPHLASVDSSGTQMRVTWVSGDNNTQLVKYTGGTATSNVTTFTKDKFNWLVPNPAYDFGWHDPGFIHTAVMTGLTPSTSYSYSFGSAESGWNSANFTTPPAIGASMVRFVIYGDLGKAERDNSSIHHINPGSIKTVDALTKRNDYDLVIHNGDISYATGFLVEWDTFLELITPVASKVPYMTTIGNHERNFPTWNSYYKLTDSGGECGVPYETYFPMPTSGPDRPWYSYASGPIHFTMMSTEHDWTPESDQYFWIAADLAAVNRTVTPWVILLGHRPAYSTSKVFLNFPQPRVDPGFPPVIEPLLLNREVDLVIWGHVHYYERTCAVYRGTCLGSPFKNSAGVDTYNNADYKAPVHAIIGTGGYGLSVPSEINIPAWSLERIADHGYGYVQANKTHLDVQFVSATTGDVGDHFIITK